MKSSAHESRDEMTDRVLIIGYGNPLRCDDGIAWRVAEEIRRTNSTAATLCVHQLTPELAEDASRAGTIIFIDAARSGAPGEVRCNAVYADRAAQAFSHNLEPDQLLSICQQLYAAKPCGFLVSIGAQCFDHGETLSSSVTAAIPRAVAMVKQISEGRVSLRPPIAFGHDQFKFCGEVIFPE